MDTFTLIHIPSMDCQKTLPRSMNLSGWGMGFHLDDMGNVCLRTSAYDGSGVISGNGKQRRDLIEAGTASRLIFLENGGFCRVWRLTGHHG